MLLNPQTLFVNVPRLSLTNLYFPAGIRRFRPRCRFLYLLTIWTSSVQWLPQVRRSPHVSSWCSLLGTSLRPTCNCLPFSYSFSSIETEDGDYMFCFDNTFSSVSEKLIFFELILDNMDVDENPDEWKEYIHGTDVVDMKLEDIMVRMHSRCEAQFTFSHYLLCSQPYTLPQKYIFHCIGSHVTCTGHSGSQLHTHNKINILSVKFASAVNSKMALTSRLFQEQ